MSVEEMKKERSKAKQQVTTASRKLSSAVFREETFETLKALMLELNHVYDNFCEINEDYEKTVVDSENEKHRVVNGEDIPTYRNNVMKCYEEASKMFIQAKQASQTITEIQQNNTDSESEETEDRGYTAQGTAQSQASPVQSVSKVASSVSSTLPSPGVMSSASVSQVSQSASISGNPSPNMNTSQMYTDPYPVPSNIYGASAQGMYTTPTLPYQSPWITGQHSSSGLAPTSSSDIRLKKIALPTFSGERRDWPEFKTVWKQLAEGAYKNKTALAHELKRCVKGEASKRIKSVYVTKPEAYEVMWAKLEKYYDDSSATVQAALEELHKLKTVSEGDYRALVEIVDDVESCYCQLEELNQLNTLTMRDVDYVNGLLPNHLKVEWIRKYHDMGEMEKIQPFRPFMSFLDREREAVSRLAENQSRKKKATDTPRGKASVHHGHSEGNKHYPCAFHRKDSIKHTTSECKEFQKLPVAKKYEVLKQAKVCFICFGDHLKSQCPEKKPCACGKEGHNPLLCKSGEQRSSNPHHVQVGSTSHASQSGGLALYPIQNAKVCGTGKTVTIFCDGGSNTTYITHRAADRIKARRLNNFTLDVTTMGNVEKSYDTCQYEFDLRTEAGKKSTITAYDMDSITGPISKLDTGVLFDLFPSYDPDCLQRKARFVDILLGCDYFGLHPKKEEAKCGDNLSVMRGEFGVCLQGTHPELLEETRCDANLAKTIHDSKIRTESNHVRLDTHTEFMPTNIASVEFTCFDKRYEESRPLNDTAETFVSRSIEAQVESFIKGEEQGTEVTPRCGGCRCNKCPIVGHTYSFKEEQELKMIKENLEYDEDKQCWITSYPWIVDPSTLPDNYSIALCTLRNTERNLMKDKQWAETYQKQIEDMLDRGAARKVSQEELKEWSGPTYYISHLAVVNTRSHSTPVRIVFNSSQVCHGTSLNACLAKGPDCYMNNLIGILLRWREEQVALVGDIRKMFNSIFLKPVEQHCHRFLWRDLETERDPDVYMMTRVNMGDTPAPAITGISTEAVYKTAELFEKESPQAASLLKRSSYVDDLIDSKPSTTAALKIAREAENMLAKGGFTVKCWQFSGESTPRSGDELNSTHVNQSNSDVLTPMSTNMLKGTDENLRVLGLGWNPETDMVVFEVNLNFSRKKKGVYTEPHLVESDLPKALPHVLTRRIVLGQVMKLYDPLGLVCPFTLIAKIYLRETWLRKLDWDEQLPCDLHAKWANFFCTLFQLEKLKLDRCLRPPDSVGRPMLVILSDGSDLAYGFAAYIRWRLQNGNFGVD